MTEKDGGCAGNEVEVVLRKGSGAIGVKWLVDVAW